LVPLRQVNGCSVFLLDAYYRTERLPLDVLSSVRTKLKRVPGGRKIILF
jgi:hypothetical protein